MGREGRGHQQRADILRPQCISGDRGHHGRVDAARKADRGLPVAVLAEEIPQSAAGRLVDQARAVVVGRGDRDRHRFGVGVENPEILLEILHHQHQFSAAVQRARRAVVDDVGRTAHLIDQHEVLALDESQVAHHLVTVGHGSLAVFAGVDRNDRLDRLVEVTLAAQIVAHDDRAFVALDRGVFIAFRRDQETHFTTRRDVFLADVAQHLAVLDQRRGADRAVRREDRKTDDGGDAVAAGGDFDQGVLAEFEEGRLTQQVEGRGSAHGLLGKNHQIGALRFRFVNGVDDLRGIAVHVSDRVIQLSYGYFHASNLSPEITTLQS